MNILSQGCYCFICFDEPEVFFSYDDCFWPFLLRSLITSCVIPVYDENLIEFKMLRKNNLQPIENPTLRGYFGTSSGETAEKFSKRVLSNFFKSSEGRRCWRRHNNTPVPLCHSASHASQKQLGINFHFKAPPTSNLNFHHLNELKTDIDENGSLKGSYKNNYIQTHFAIDPQELYSAIPHVSEVYEYII
jgi:hypothetical protein